MWKKGDVLVEGKTKRIFDAEATHTDTKHSGHPVIVESKPDITAFDDPTKTKQIEAKAAFATSTTCRVFELLKAAGIPVAYYQQVSPTEFLAEQCTMIPLEMVARRYAVGSYLKRHPELVCKEDEQPHRFHKLVCEFFLKTTRGELILPDGTRLVEGLKPEAGEEDPFIANPMAMNWKLSHPKLPAWVAEADLNMSVNPNAILPGTLGSSKERTHQIVDYLQRVFLVLEGAWTTLGLRLIDMKIEFGIDSAGQLRVADVIDNDSWRLRTHDWEELSKQAFRDGESLDEVELKYGTVAGLVERFRIPNQALICWRGSLSDDIKGPSTSTIPGITIDYVTMSGHKSTQACLIELERIMGKYPDGGVIVVKVGRSNGLGPILAAHTTWPVIAVPATMDSFPADAWSSIRMPSHVPLATVWPEKNAIELALNILARTNPLVYALRQREIEDLD